MSVRFRLLLLIASTIILLPAVVVLALGMPAFGAHPLPYGDAINRDAPGQRHISNMVSAVNFDYRGFDTMGEEFMLVTAVTGAVMLLRGTRGESPGAEPEEVPGRSVQPAGEAIVLICRLMLPVSLLFGIYVVLHATATPGGGFQGGVIIASAVLLLYLGDGYRVWRSIVRSRLLHLCEGGAAAAFVLTGLVPMLLGHAFLENILPTGQFRDMLAGWLMQIENLAVAFAVAGGFAMLFLEFLEETRAPKGEE
ncbi:MAG TPA: MnhB domain-containing protein [Rhodopila sp.]